MAAAILAKHAEAFGFRPGEVEPERWIEYEEVQVDLARVGRLDGDYALRLD